MTEVTRPTDFEGIAADLLRDEPALVSSLGFGELVKQGVGPGPSVWIGDLVGIPLYTPASVEHFDHRLALLARPGDIVVVRHRVPEFEAYLDRYLGISGVTYLKADARSPVSVAEQCRTRGILRDALERVLQRHGALTVQPYLASGHTWRLASELGASLDVAVHVAGPGPRLARRSNDKLWFWDLARRITGARSVPPTWYAFGPAAAAGHVARLIKHFDDVVVKVPGSAGATGNLRLKASGLRNLRVSAISAFLDRQLSATGWDATYPVLVGVWEGGVSASPSVQMWIPKAADGPPRILGLFEQAVAGQVSEFVGARPAEIGRALEDRMTDEARAIADVLQRLGFFGPVSFDAVLQKGPAGEADLHWIECNGRWTGVSIPLAAAGRILQHQTPHGLVILQTNLSASPVSDMEGLLRALDGLLIKGSAQEGIAILSPPIATHRPTFNAMVLANSQPQAEEIARLALRRLSKGA